MKRKIAFTVALLAVGTIVFLGYRVWRDAAAKRATAERIRTLPPFELQALGGQVLSESDLGGSGKPLVLMYFRTTCHFCQGETESIKKHGTLRRAAPVIMVSAEGRGALRQFKEEYGLAQVAGVHLARDSAGTVAETFGVSAVPATFVYGADGRLLKHFRGEASAEAIYAALQDEGDTSASSPQAADSAAAPGGCGMGASLAEAGTASADTTSDCLPSEN